MAQADRVKIVFLGESSAQDFVWQYRVKQMVQAATHNRVDFIYRFAEGNYERHARMIQEEVNRGVDAIIGPWWNEVIYNTAITNAVKRGVFVYGLLGIEPKKTLSPDIVQKLGWCNVNWTEFGQRLAKIAIDFVPSGGTVFWPAETSKGSYIIDAVNGFKSYFAERKLSIQIDVVEIGFDTKKAVTLIQKQVSSHSVSAIVTSGAMAVDAANIAAHNTQASRVFPPIIGQVISPAAVQGIIKGYMPGGVNLELTQSSRDAIINTLDVVVHKNSPKQSSVSFLNVTKNNVLEVVPNDLK